MYTYACDIANAYVHTVVAVKGVRGYHASDNHAGLDPTDDEIKW